MRVFLHNLKLVSSITVCERLKFFQTDPTAEMLLHLRVQVEKVQASLVAPHVKMAGFHWGNRSIDITAIGHFFRAEDQIEQSVIKLGLRT